MRFARLTVAAAALAVATATLTPAVSGATGPGAPTAQYRVTLKASTKVAVAKEDKVALTGAVYPTPPEGSQVLVQVQYEKTNAWVKAGTAKVKGDGTYRFVDKPKTTRDRVYRVVKHADKLAKQDKSRERALHVIGWSWLTDLIPSATENVFKAATMPINGDDYAHTLYVDRAFTTGFTEFTLGRDCTSLEATYGLSDRTETGGRAAISVSSDGVGVYSRTFDLGQSELVTTDVTGVYRIRLDFAQVAGTPPTEPSAGAGRVLCD